MIKDSALMFWLVFAFILYWSYNSACGSWPPPWFCNSKFFWSGVVSPEPINQPRGPGTTVRLLPNL
jgi:hypothetical protein